jgi:dynein heavy chain
MSTVRPPHRRLALAESFLIFAPQFLCPQCDRLTGGLQKIADASDMLAILNEKLAIQKVAVTEKTAACEALLEEIASGTKQASEKKVVAEAKGKEIEEQSVIIAVEKVC